MSNEAYSFTIMGDPIAWARAGVTNGRFYDRQKHDKLLWGIAIEGQYERKDMLKGPLALAADFYFRIPKTYVKKKEQMINTPHMQDPDIDNCCKFLMDVCTGILFKDDNCISIINCRKLWAEESKIQFTFSEIG